MPGRFSPAPWLRALAVALLCVGKAANTPAVIHEDTGDPTAYTTTPGDNSGWQFEGQWGGYLGTPIAPYYFLSAGHIGNAGGGFFVFHGETFKVMAGYADPNSDLCLWKVDHAFATYAPVFQPRGNAEVGQEVRVFGCGAQRGGEVTLDDTLRGWSWGDSGYIERWGRNVVSAAVSDGAAPYLQTAFDSPGLPGEAHLSAGDSGGGEFILQDGLWRLAGINYGVDDLYTGAGGSGHLVAAIFDARGYYAQNSDGTFSLIAGDNPQPTSFYGTRVSARLDWIKSIVGTHAFDALPAENFDAWAHAYFTPDQLSDSSVSSFDADPDADGVPNGLEFAFNLDPTCAEPATMTAGTGLRGLPLVRLEDIAGVGPRLTVEFVRRTAGSGSGLTYTAQFASSLDPAAGGWQAGGTQSVTAINERWERVKVTDTAAGTARFARVLVTRTVDAL